MFSTQFKNLPVRHTDTVKNFEGEKIFCEGQLLLKIRWMEREGEGGKESGQVAGTVWNG